MLLKFLKQLFLIILIFVFTIEILLQVLFFYNVSFVKQPALFYNGFCDQKYWNIINRKAKYDEKIVYHPILAIKKKEIFIPNKFNKTILKENNKFSKNKIALYGSSFMDHKDFQRMLKNNEEIKFKNYSLGSYGLDQIYLSYKLTSHLNQNGLIVFGFLLEDLDRSIFDKRDYNKPKFLLNNNNFKLTNVPIQQNSESIKNLDFYLFKFSKNFFELLKNNFDSRLSKCFINYKKKIFEFFLTDIQNEAAIYNQKIIIITFNLKEDLIRKESWRYDYIKKYLEQKNTKHLDSLEILKKKSLINNENIEDYYASDLHNSEKGFDYIVKEFFNIYNAM